MAASEVRFNTGEPAPEPPATPPANASDDGKGGVQFNAPAKPASGDAGDGQPGADSRPEWLPEKFKSPEDLAAAYKALEKKASAKPAPATPPSGATSDEGIPFAALNEEFAKTGEISEKTLKALEAKGVPPQMVTGYIEGQKAIAARNKADLASGVGGEEKFDAIVAWAADNLEAEQIDGYNALVDAGNLKAAKSLLQTFAAQYAEAGQSEPSNVTGSAKSGTTSEKGGYASTAEMVRDMKKPEYQSDPAFRAKVHARVAKTTAF